MAVDRQVRISVEHKEGDLPNGRSARRAAHPVPGEATIALGSQN